MVDLKAKTPCEGLLPVRIGSLTIAEEPFQPLTLLSPYKGQEKPLSAAMKKAHDLGVPAPGARATTANAEAIWFGRGQTLLIGPAPDEGLSKHAAVTDQSDAWAVVTLQGAGAEEALARLIPVDLRPATFPQTATARTLIGHMNGSVTRTGPDSFRLMVFRSMAATLVHELKDAMETVAARVASPSA